MKRFRHLLVFAAALATLGVAVAPAHAHTLDRVSAANDASLAAYDWAESEEWRYHDALFGVDLTRSDCERSSRRVFSCDGDVEFSEWRYGTYSDWEEITFCSLTVRVRLVTYDTRTKVRRDWCV
jgi:hypothetical protein